MSRVFRGMFLLLVAMNLVQFRSFSDTDVESSKHTSETSASRDYVAELESGRAFKDAKPEIRSALLTLIQTASRFKGFGKNEIEKSPGTEIKRAESEHSLKVVKKSTDGTETTYVYDIGDERLSIVTRTKADGTRLGITFYNLEIMGIHSAWLSEPNRKGSIEFTFYPATVQPKRAFIFSKPVESGDRVGRIMAWSEAGDEIANLEIPGARNPFELTQGMLPLLDENQSEALSILPSLRLTSRPAFRLLAPEFQNPMQRLVVYSEKLLRVSPEELQEALRGDVIERFERNNAVEYRVSSRTEPEWVVRYDLVTSRLMSARFGELNMFFEGQETSRLAGGYVEIESEKDDGPRYLLMGLYPGAYLPRSSMTAHGPAVSNANLTGEVKFWSSSGALILNTEFVEPVSLLEGLEVVQSRLEPEQRRALEWRGADAEAKRLIGELLSN